MSRKQGHLARTPEDDLFCANLRIMLAIAPTNHRVINPAISRDRILICPQVTNAPITE